VNTLKLTPSQAKAIEIRKRIFSEVYPDAEYQIWQPRNMDLTVLIAFYSAKNMLGTTSRFQQSWDIGKRGKVTNK
jgi:hypothetical protein